MLVIAVPVIINSLIQTCYNLTDTFWLGKVGTDALAAINLVTPVQNIVINFGSGISVAGSVLISQYLGAGRKEDANRMTNQVFSCAVLFACACAGLICLITPALVRWLGAEGGVQNAGISYLRIVILDMPFLFTVNVFQAVSQSRGNTIRPMLINLMGVLINMVLDPLLMSVLNLGAAGAALATVGAKAAAAAVALAALMSRRGELRLKRDELKPQREQLRQIVHIGLPTALGSSMMQFGFLLMSRTVLTYGSQAMAAYGIGNKINGLISMPSNAMGSATATMTALNTGAGKPERARKGCRISILCSVCFLFAGGLVISRPAISRVLVSIFSADEAVIAMAADFLALMAFWAWSNGFYNSLTGLFQGTGHTEITMVSDASRLWVYRFATLWFCEKVLHLGVRSVWLSVVISNGIAALVLYILYRKGLWRKNRVRHKDTKG
ncbi:MAG: MATE family efflux transporter [Clostridia bacterium]|nr:MATE family efflux transporter [Clostridia bacterium]MBR2662096.1 MATE family efflux transporter [Clostridia bacterium]